MMGPSTIQTAIWVRGDQMVWPEVWVEINQFASPMMTMEPPTVILGMKRARL